MAGSSACGRARPFVQDLADFGHRNRVILTLLELAVIAEDFAKNTLDKLPQSVDGNHIDARTWLHTCPCVVKIQVKELLSGFGRQVGDNHVKPGIFRHCTKSIAEVHFYIIQMIELGIFLRVIDRNEILVYQVNAAKIGLGSQFQYDQATIEFLYRSREGKKCPKWSETPCCGP